MESPVVDVATRSAWEKLTIELGREAGSYLASHPEFDESAIGEFITGFLMCRLAERRLALGPKAGA
jgi:hypothetical protein